MGSVEQMVDVDLPVRTVYDQWTQFEDFPRFMKGVEEVRQIDDRHLHWKATVAGVTREWDAEIIEQVPDRVIAWRSTNGIKQWGQVSFDELAANKTRVVLRMEIEPHGLVERVGDALQVP